MAEDGKKSLKYRQSKGNNSAITDNIPIKLHIHNLTMVIYIQFHELPSIGYLVMAEDGKIDRWRNRKDTRTEGQTKPNQYPSAFGRRMIIMSTQNRYFIVMIMLSNNKMILSSNVSDWFNYFLTCHTLCRKGK